MYIRLKPYPPDLSLNADWAHSLTHFAACSSLKDFQVRLRNGTHTDATSAAMQLASLRIRCAVLGSMKLTELLQTESKESKLRPLTWDKLPMWCHGQGDVGDDDGDETSESNDTEWSDDGEDG